MAIISHFWIIGLIIATVLNINRKNTFTRFYIRQMIGINLLILLNSYLILNLLGELALSIGGLVIFILWIISLVGAISGAEKEVPFVGEYFQNWFHNF